MLLITTIFCTSPKYIFCSFVAWVANFTQKSLNDLKIKQIEVAVSLIKENMKELFKFYATFNYERFVVCPFFGKANIQISNYEKSMPKR